MTVERPTQPIISIVVPCRNEKGRIEGFLRSLFRQEIDGDYEILIADGQSDDGTREILERCAKARPQVRIVDNPKRHAAAGLNLAIQQARGEICLRMDVHTEYAPDYVRRSVECLLSTGADNVGGPARTNSESVLQRTVAAAFHSWFSTGGAAFHDVNFEGYVDTVPYGCWWRAKLIEIGMFDEDLVRNEDDELNLRLMNAGGRVYQSPAIRSWYYPRSSLGALARQYFQYGFWKVLVIRKHRRVPSWRHLVPSMFVLVNLLLLIAGALYSFDRESFLDPTNCLLAVNGAYALCSIVASLALAPRTGWLGVLCAPFVFAAFHLGYGIGFLIGWIYYMWDPTLAARNEAFTGLTR